MENSGRMDGVNGINDFNEVDEERRSSNFAMEGMRRVVSCTQL
jgi:hypothetical protein